MPYKIAQLSISPGAKSSVASDIFIAQPDSIKEELAGKLFVIIELEQNNSTSIKIINYLIDIVNHHYYQNEKILLREKVSTLKVEHIFEAALAKSNKQFMEFLNSEKINLENGMINITVGVIHENILHFANSGKNKVILVYEAPAKASPGEDRNSIFQTVDVTKQSGSEAVGKGRITKLFSNVVSGPIPKNAAVLVSNEALPEYISNKKLTEIIMALPPLSAVEQIKNTLSAINSYVSFSGIIIRNMTNDKTAEQLMPIKRTTEESILNLNRTEESTETLLTPSGIINVKKWLGHIFTLAGNNRARSASKTNYETRLNLKDKIIVKRKTSNTLNQLFSVFGNIFTFTTKAIPHLFILFKKKSNIVDLKNNLKDNANQKIDSFFSRVFSLSRKSKILLIMAVFLLIFFFYNLSVIKSNKQVEREEENYDHITTLIEQKQNQAEANLLYSNEGGAKNLFNEIKTLMDELPQDTEEQKQKYGEFRQKYNTHMEKIRRMTRLQTQEIADFANLNGAANPENISFINGNGKIYSADSKQRSIYILDTRDNIITTITDLSLPIVSLKGPALNKEDFIYYINGGNIVEFSISNEQMKTYNIVPESGQLVNIDTYNNRLYALTGGDFSIIRYAKAGQSFGSPYSWLAGQPDLANPVDISIDGHVYVLLSDGAVKKYLVGEEVEFSLNEIDPPLANPSKIFVSSEKNHLYILEPSEKRLVVYDKTGKFIVQYTADSFEDLRDFQVNESNGEIFFLCGSKVHKAASQHMAE